MSESYSYNGTTGNLASKGGVDYTAYDANHKHAVTTLSNGNTYGYDNNGNMTSRYVSGQSFTLNYDAENRLVSVTGAATASFSYDADGRQVIGTVNGVTTYGACPEPRRRVGNHYEVKNDVVTKYYFAGATRLAVRTGGTLSFLLADHIGSSSVTTDANGGYSAMELYKAFGESRYTYGTLGTDYKFTGQRSEAALGIYWFQSRWYDGALGRFTQPDTIVPTQTQGTQAWDRYAFVNNNPVRYNDPTGHGVNCGIGEGCMGNQTNPNDLATNGKDIDSGGDGEDEGNGEDDECPSDVETCIVKEHGHATQQDLLNIQNYISQQTIPMLTNYSILLGLITLLGSPQAFFVLAELQYETADLNKLAAFISAAESVRATSPGGVLPMTVYREMNSDGKIGEYSLYYSGTTSKGDVLSDTFTSGAFVSEIILLILEGRE